MTEVVLFHHAHGQTAGFMLFAEELRGAGHVVHTPDLYEGKTFVSLDDGVAYADGLGMEEFISRGTDAVAEMSRNVVYGGFSLGAVVAQSLAQTRPGALGALLYHGGNAVSEFGAPWPDGAALQMHSMEGDEWVEIDVLEELTEEIPGAELYLYPGSAHLFADSSLDDYDEVAARLLIQRSLSLLSRLE